MYSVIGQNMSVQHVQEDTGDESLHRHQIPRDLNTFLQGLLWVSVRRGLDICGWRMRMGKWG